jgi:hypothetical protein
MVPCVKTRKAISTKTRFDVFKRDLFVCQYCGSHPPQVILHVDHIVAVAEGGTNDNDNLVTACADCNLGKGVRSLRSVPQSLADKAALVAESEAQLAGYHAILSAKRIRLDADANAVAGVYEHYHEGYTLSHYGLVSVRRFVEKLGVDSVAEAMEIACHRWPARDSRIYRYFCGICWNRIRGDE